MLNINLILNSYIYFLENETEHWHSYGGDIGLHSGCTEFPWGKGISQKYVC